MTDIQNILYESFYLLFEKPQLFVPKVFVALISSLFIVLVVDRFMELFQLMTPFQFLGFITVAIFLMSYTALYAALMVVSMVKNDWSDGLLKKSFLDVFEESAKMLKVTLGFMFLSIGLAFFVAIGFQASVLTGSIIYLLVTSVIAFIGIMAVTFVVYFLPVTLLEDVSLGKSFKLSMNTSKDNSKEVTVLLVVSVLLLIMAVLSSGMLEKLGYIGFIVGRMISTVMNTYLFVVSPKYYEEIN